MKDTFLWVVNRAGTLFFLRIVSFGRVSWQEFHLQLPVYLFSPRVLEMFSTAHLQCPLANCLPLPSLFPPICCALMNQIIPLLCSLPMLVFLGLGPWSKEDLSRLVHWPVAYNPAFVLQTWAELAGILSQELKIRKQRLNHILSEAKGEDCPKNAIRTPLKRMF